MRRYVITVEGFEPHTRIAETAGKAKYADFKAYRAAGYGDRYDSRNAFRDYLQRAHVLHLGPARLSPDGGVGDA